MTNPSTFAVSCRIYLLLLRLYPKSLRTEFGEEMREVFHDQLSDARCQHRVLGPLRVWQCVAGETARTLAEAYLQALGVSMISALLSLIIMCVMLGTLSR